MNEERIFIQSVGIKLEGLQSIQKREASKFGIILCHPHPLYGGDMYNPVIEMASKVAQEEGISTLRFNFRGVGNSEGAYGEGIGEMEDVKAAIKYFYSKLLDNNPYLILLGYSFGVRVGFPIAVHDDRIKGMVAIAPVVEFDDFEYLKGCKKEKLFIAGEDDPYCPPNKLKELFEKLDEPKRIFIIPGVDHFFFNQHKSIVQPLREFFNYLINNPT